MNYVELVVIVVLEARGDDRNAQGGRMLKLKGFVVEKVTQNE